MDKKVGNILKYGISIALAAVLLYFSFRGVSWAGFIEGLRSCRWGFIALSMLAGLCAFWMRGLRWRELLLPIDGTTSSLTCFNAVNISYLVNMVLPRVGEFVRCGYITARSGRDPESKTPLASYDKVLGTAALERSADVLAMFSILVVFLVFTWRRFGGFFNDQVLGGVRSGLTTGKILILIAVLALAAAFIFIAAALSGKSRVMGRISGFCKGIWEGFISCLKMKGAWKFFALTAGIWFCYFVMSAAVLWSLQGISPASVSPDLASALQAVKGLDLTDALFLMIVGSLSSIVPVPGGFGAFHFLVSAAMKSVYGIPFQFGMVFATLSHESQAVNQIFWGGVSWIIESTRKSDGQSNSQSNNQSDES